MALLWQLLKSSLNSWHNLAGILQTPLRRGFLLPEKNAHFAPIIVVVRRRCQVLFTPFLKKFEDISLYLGRGRENLGKFWGI
jgi:hypothetical protein